jgi:hypothetical protein
VQTVKFNKMIAVVLPYRSVLTDAQGKLQTDSVLIALAEEGSDKWSVFDGTGQTLRSPAAHSGYAGGWACRDQGYQGRVVPAMSAGRVK